MREQDLEAPPIGLHDTGHVVCLVLLQCFNVEGVYIGVITVYTVYRVACAEGTVFVLYTFTA